MDNKQIRMAIKYHLHMIGGSDLHGEHIKSNIELAVPQKPIAFLARIWL